MKLSSVVFLIVMQLSVTAMAAQPRLTVSRSQIFSTLARASTDGTAPVDTSKWKTYTNEKHGFELKYPDTWKVNAASGTGPEIISLNKPSRAGEANASLTLAIQSNQNPERSSIEKWFADQLQRMNRKPDSSGHLRLGGQSAIFMENANSFGVHHDVFMLLHEVDVLSLGYTRDTQLEPIYAAMLSSFRLVK